MSSTRLESLQETDLNFTHMDLLNMSLTETYKDAKNKINNLVPPKIPSFLPPFTQDEIIENLETLMYSVVRAMYHSELGLLNIEYDVNHTYYEESIRDKLVDITYGIIFASSDFMLGSLLYYMERSFIFSYIKNNVVRPNIFDMVHELREEKAKETKMQIESETKVKIYDLVHEIINTFIYRGDMFNLETGLKELREIKMEGTLKVEAINYALSQVNVICPDLLKELLRVIDTDNNMIENGSYDRTIEIMNGLKEFFRRYMTTHTHDAMKLLLREYYLKIPYNIDDIITRTLHERNAAYVCHGPFIDDMTYDELRTANAILNKRNIEIDNEIVDNNMVLQNIIKIIDSHAVYDDKCYIEGDTLFIRRSENDIREYKYKDIKVMSVIDDAFYIFGKNAAFVRKAFEEGKSCLQQTGCLDTDTQALNLSNPRALPRLKPEERILHRKREITKLLGMLRHSKETMARYNEIRNQDPIKRFSYINPFQISHYKETNPSTLLLKLVETEAVYDMVMHRLANPPKKVDPHKKKGSRVFAPPKGTNYLPLSALAGLGGTIDMNKL